MDLDAVSDELFDDLVAHAMDRLPAEVAAHMDNVALFVADDAPPEDPELLGLYDGIALTERTGDYGFMPPDTISLFKNNLVAMCADEGELADEIFITIVHEIAHHFGVDEDRLHELGWG
ncbi:metallopeptidase family protein [Brevibacterium sp. 50QC2O2]|jgi:predicted Zn-dependent protease with MMP-like domain|uniref:metallopeptidase family protein n=1 Tax=Brevibacterium TaxID=1696 RepID=UPI00211C4C47|nr:MULTISPECIES: metallopeptidase family protein [unclassified Brevibacterium]MCQ9368121.1 metallopeptidase family protein [Brevibacterium sp. 91QC2O2]MCQ9386060.1 metallopeptidase family protein [Brevibacterium sp. 68QC2CO]MCQ9387648.1 metallopeptidase family protein [Brevibacterium sp. 50QC2O2]